MVARRRRYSWPEFSPHRSDVQSIANGMLVTDATITLFASSRSGLPFSGPKHSPGGNHTVVAARLRRDGFASISNAGRVGGAKPTVEAQVITRTVVWDVSLVHLFVNVKIAPGGWCRVGLRDPRTNTTLSGFDPSESTLTPADRSGTAFATEEASPQPVGGALFQTYGSFPHSPLHGNHIPCYWNHQDLASSTASTRLELL